MTDMSDKIQVVIVDDHPLFRDGVLQTLKAEPDIEIVGKDRHPRPLPVPARLTVSV